MKIALCTTTIHVPHALKLLRKCSDDVRFFVACDYETPIDVINLTNMVGNTWREFPSTASNWKCSEAIGWSTLARRNIAFLEALKWGADVIYSWDNDNLPISTDHFLHIENAFTDPFNGICVGEFDWFDPGSLLIPSVRHRGFPYDMPHRSKVYSIVDAKIGVAAGLVLGDSDVDATTRLELHPNVTQTHQLAQVGVVVDSMTWTVFNSQNTAVIRELVPAWFMMPGVGRYDDIYASLIVQRIMRKHRFHVHFGPPFTYQQRNEHNLITNLRAEIHGMDNVTSFAQMLDSLELIGTSVIKDVWTIYMVLRAHNFVPLKSIDAALLWLEDCESVL